LKALSKGQHRWGFVCGQISVLEGQLMSYDFFVSLASLEKTDDMLHRIQETSLREFMVPGAETWEDWSTIIDNYVHDQIFDLKKASPSSEITDVFLLSEDYINLKRALNGKDSLFPENVFTETRLTDASSGNPSLFPETIRPAISIVCNPAGAHVENPLITDIVLDGCYLRHYLWLLTKLNCPLLKDWAENRVLSKLIVLLWRALKVGHNLKLFQQYLLPLEPFNHLIGELCATTEIRSWGNIIPGIIGDIWRECFELEEDEQIPKFEQKVSDLLTDMAKLAKLQTMGPEHAGAFCWGLNVEAFNLKLIISGKLNGLPSNMLKDRIRQTYV